MAVYVDDAGIFYKGKPRYHLTADTLDELHAFCRLVHINRCWYHASEQHPHYDVIQEQRETALAAGAFSVSPRILSVKAAGAAAVQQFGMAVSVVPVGDFPTVTYWYPHITQRFTSPMHALENLGAGENEIGRRVCQRLKPVGVIHIPESHKEDREVAMSIVRECGGVAVQYADDPGLIAITIDGVIGEVLNLEALADDYRAWCEVIPHTALRQEVLRDIIVELKRLRPMPFADFADFGKIIPQVHPTRDGHLPSGWVRCGLLFGYPPATTAAYVLRDAGILGTGSDLENLKNAMGPLTPDPSVGRTTP